jgi:hypothetical protein
VGANWTVTVVLVPGLSVTGKVPPTMEKPVPVADTEETVSAAVPVEDKVRVCFVEVPSVTDPKLKAVVLSDKVGVVVATPVPPRETVEVAPVAELLLMVRLPVADPAVCGEKAICTVSD